MALLFRTHLRLARTSIRKNRTRSFLTCLGIAVGVASIILILSLTSSISNLVTSEIASVGSDLIVVRPSSQKDTTTSIIDELTSAAAYQSSNLTMQDAEAIASLPDVTAVAPIAISTHTVMNDDNTVASATLLGTTPSFNVVDPLSLQHGTFISDKNPATSVVIGHTMSLLLFNSLNPVGNTFAFRGERFMVIGVLEEIDATINLNNIDYNNAIIMDISALERLLGSIQIQQINVKVVNAAALPTVATAITTTLEERNSGDTNFSVAYGDAITHPASAMLTIISSMLALVAGISLLVGGIGIMNIMLVSVAERDHEIGIRKAVGASTYNILMQFMLEALLLSLWGGVFGIIIGYLFAFLVSIITPFAPVISWEIVLVTFLTAAVVGVIFGIYPAVKAASKNPIESLKHYR